MSNPAAGIRSEGRCPQCGGVMFRGGYSVATDPAQIMWHPYLVCGYCGQVVRDE